MTTRPTNLINFDIKPLVENEFAADVSGVQAASVSEGDFDLLYNIWLEYGVVRLRKQVLSDDDLVRFSRRFGNLDIAPPNETVRQSVEGFPEILVVTNVREDGQAIGILGNGEAQWHTDMSYVETPPKASLLYALETPNEGGNTSFIDMHHAVETLGSEIVDQLRSMSIKHDASTNSAGFARLGSTHNDDPRRGNGCSHPLIIRHPETGRPALYLGRRHRAWVCGLGLEESEQKLDWLWNQTLAQARIWTQIWQPGDLLIWDNRAVMHQRNAFDDSLRRRMHRTQVSGDSAPAAANGQ